MSSTPATNTAGASVSGHTQTAKPANAQSARSGADLFASMLGLLSATHDIPLDGEDTEGLLTGLPVSDAESDAARENPLGDELSDDALNPLAALLGWPGAPHLNAATMDGSTNTPAASTDADPGVATGSGPNLSLAATKGRADGVSLEGMTLLDKPEQADPELLAGLQRGDAPVAPSSASRSNTVGIHPARTDSAALASRPANWRSTTTLANPASAGASQNTTTALQRGQLSPMRLPPETMAASVRSTVALDDRFSASLAADTAVESSLGAQTGHAGSTSGNGQPPAGGTGLGLSGAVDTTDRANADTEFSLHPEIPADEAAPNEPTVNPHSLRHASLRVGNGGEEGSIDIRLALQGEQLSVDFRTDNVEARANLQQHANGSLADMLQRNGIQLGDVSVGAQSQGQPGQPGHAPHTRASNATGRDTAAASSPVQPAAPARRADGSHPLDLFV